MLALLVSALTVAVNLAAYVMDYRVMNAMPIIFLLFGMGLATVEKAMEGRAVRALLTILIGGGLVHSVAAYFSHDDNAALRDLYATQEVALARSIKKLRSPGMAYAVDIRDAPVPPLTLKTWITPVDAKLRAISIISSGPSPPVRH